MKIAGAAFCAALAVVLYLLIASLYLNEASDHVIHLQFAEKLYTRLRPSSPHFLYQLLLASVVAVSHVSFKTAAYIVLGAAQALTGVLLFKQSRSVIVVAAILLMQPVLEWGDSQLYSIGYLWAEPYNTPTFALTKPFALLAFWFAVRPQRSLIALAAAATVLGVLAKPSFAMCLLPAVLLISLRKDADRRSLYLGIVLPAVAILGAQFLVSFSGLLNRGYQNSVVFAPLKVMSYYANHLLLKLVLSALFPIAIYLLYWRRAKADAALTLAATCFAFGVAYTYLLSESVAWQTGNFLWSGYLALFVFYVVAVLFFTRQVTEWPAERWRHLAALAVLLLHVRSGVLTWYATYYSASPHWRK